MNGRDMDRDLGGRNLDCKDLDSRVLGSRRLDEWDGRRRGRAHIRRRWKALLRRGLLHRGGDLGLPRQLGRRSRICNTVEDEARIEGFRKEMDVFGSMSRNNPVLGVFGKEKLFMKVLHDRAFPYQGRVEGR